MADSENKLQAAIAGDEPALMALLEDASPALHADMEKSIGQRYRGVVEADDIVQVTYLEAFLRIRSFRPERADSFTAWLRRIAANNLRDAIRTLEREKRPPPGKRAHAPVGDESYSALVNQLAVTTSTPSRVVIRDELRASVDAALRQLPQDYEQVLRLYELAGLSGEEVAEHMGRSHGAVRMMLARARERLAELLIGGEKSAGSA